MRTQKFYVCKKCGNTAWKLCDTGAPLSCCGEVMSEMEENPEGPSKEKHIPVITRMGDRLRVAVGSQAHVMDPDHYICLIAVATGLSMRVKRFSPGDVPEFVMPAVREVVKAYAFCNLHGLWTACE